MVIIFLHTYDFSRPSWVVLDGANVTACVRHGHPEALAALTANDDVMVLVPTEDVLLTTVTLPSMNRSRLLQALPFALEEQLISDIDSLHFAIGERQANGELPVAVVSQAKMQEWTQLLQLWQVRAEKMVPMGLALPEEPNTWQVMVDEQALVRTKPYQAFACEPENLCTILTMACESNLPAAVNIRFYQTAEHRFEWPKELAVKEEFHDGDRFLIDLAQQASAIAGINLLQGAYRAKKSRLPHAQKVLRLAVVLVCAWVALLFLYPAVSHVILQQRAQALESQIAAIYHRHFPESTRVVAPRQRLEEKLKALNAQQTEDVGLIWLGYVGQGISQVSGITINSFDLQQQRLSLNLSATSSESMTAFSNYLLQQGLSVKQQDVTLSGTRVKAVLIIGAAT